MTLFDYFKKKEIQIVNKDEKRPVESNISRYIDMPVQIYRASQDMDKFKSAVTISESLQSPQRYQLYQIYINIILDAHLSAAMQQRKNLTLSKKFRVLNKSGEVDETKSALINKKWFREYLDLSLESLFWGHSLIQFGDLIKDEFTSVSLVPRQYVKPEFNVVTKTWGDITGANYLEDPYKSWLISVGYQRDLGLLKKAAPYIIWKQSALGAWAEFQEGFGLPFRYAKTNIRDDVSRKSAIDMMRNWGVGKWGVFDKDDLVQFLETTKQDAHKVFAEMINLVNGEISKLFLGQGSTMDEKTYSGSANVHERVLESYAEADEHFISGVNNYQLVPLLIEHGILSEGDCIEAEESEEISVIEKSKIIIELIKTGKYKMSIDQLKEEFGIEMEEIEQVDPATKYNESLQNYYS